MSVYDDIMDMIIKAEAENDELRARYAIAMSNADAWRMRWEAANGENLGWYMLVQEEGCASPHYERLPTKVQEMIRDGRPIRFAHVVDGHDNSECVYVPAKVLDGLDEENKKLVEENDSLRDLVRELSTQVNYRTVFGYATDLEHLIKEIEKG